MTISVNLFYYIKVEFEGGLYYLINLCRSKAFLLLCSYAYGKFTHEVAEFLYKL